MKIEIRTKPRILSNSIYFDDVFIMLDDTEVNEVSITMRFATEWVISNRHNVIHCDEGEDIPLTPEKFFKSVHFTEKIQKQLIEFSINKLITNK